MIDKPKFKVGDRVRTKGYDDGDPDHFAGSQTGTIVDKPVCTVLFTRTAHGKQYRSNYVTQPEYLIKVDSTPGPITVGDSVHFDDSIEWNPDPSEVGTVIDSGTPIYAMKLDKPSEIFGEIYAMSEIGLVGIDESPY